LISQGEVLGRHVGPMAQEGDDGPQKESNQAEHAERIRAEKESEEKARGAQEPQSAEAHVPRSDTLWDSGV